MMWLTDGVASDETEHSRCERAFFQELSATAAWWLVCWFVFLSFMRRFSVREPLFMSVFLRFPLFLGLFRQLVKF